MSAPAASVLANLRLVLEVFAGGPLPAWATAAASITEVKLKPGDVLFSHGEPHPYVYFVLRGLVKVHNVAPDGHQRILSFVDENQFLASVSALRPARIQRIHDLHIERSDDDLLPAVLGVTRSYATAIEETQLARVPYAVIETLSDRHVRWANLLMTYFYIHVLHLQSDAFQMRFMSAEDRYRNILAEQPRLVGRVTQRDLAAFLGVTEVGLSRIVARVRRSQAPGLAPDTEGR